MESVKIIQVLFKDLSHWKEFFRIITQDYNIVTKAVEKKWKVSRTLQMNQELCDLEGCRKSFGLGDFNTGCESNFYCHIGEWFCGIESSPQKRKNYLIVLND